MNPPRGLGWVRAARVGTTNRPKIAAARAALAPFAPQARVAGAEVASGVSEQPVGFEELLRGAENRARAALAAGGDLGIGIEDGLVDVAASVTDLALGHLNLGCAVVFDGARTGVGFSSGFAYPPEVLAPAVEGREPIGPLFDRLWQARRGESTQFESTQIERTQNASGRSVGNVGKLTGGVLTRQEYGRHAVVCALLRFLHPDLYGDEARDKTREAVA